MWTSGQIVIGCRHNTQEFIDTLIANGRPPAGVVTIGPITAEINAVPTWVDLHTCYKNQFPVYIAESYSLKSPQDRKYLESCRASVGFCIGWQRLLPDWFLETVEHGVYGMHTCQYFLPRGRGRSPLNWALIHGAERVHAHIFKYSDQPDEGNILAIEPIPITPHDDIHSLQQKSRVLFNRVVEIYWDAIVSGAAEYLESQPGVPDHFYPKRSPADGHINWMDSVRDVHNFVRAQTKPYPGAFVFFNGGQHHIWHVAPFGLPVRQPRSPGTVVELFYDKSLVIQAGDGLIHVLDHELPATICIGDILE